MQGTSSDAGANTGTSASGNGAETVRSVRVDLHTHPLADGRFNDAAQAQERIARHLEAAMEAGLDVIGITDHDELRTGLLAVEYAESQNLPLLVIAGMEVTTDEGHLVALGISEPIPAWRTIAETVPLVRAQGGSALLPHPFSPQLRARQDVDAMERLNHRYGDFPVQRDDIAVIASSDAHAPEDLLANPYVTVLEVTDVTLAGVQAALLARRVAILERSRVGMR